MKAIFDVECADFSESYSGRFTVSNEQLDIHVDDYNLKDAINIFLAKFKEEYEYLRDIFDVDLNKDALKRKEIFGQYITFYKEVTK